LICSACSTPQSVTQNFVLAMANGDSDKAMEYLHIADRNNIDEIVFIKEVILPTFMRKFLRLSSHNGGVANVQIDSVQENGNRAKVLYSVQFKNGRTIKDSLWLQKDSGWYVLR
ncbi:MAG: DUF4878 domain-containing protein, partial [Helicobacter sp.]|nr:DUF4878 domain-containing protein [Helicobacter sp.]